MVSDLSDFKTVFFIGIAGTGMSAIAQYLAGTGKQVSGSDRYFLPAVFNDTRNKLEALGIQCFLQDGEGISRQQTWLLFQRLWKIPFRKCKKRRG